MHALGLPDNDFRFFLRGGREGVAQHLSDLLRFLEDGLQGHRIECEYRLRRTRGNLLAWNSNTTLNLDRFGHWAEKLGDDVVQLGCRQSQGSVEAA